MACDRDIFTFTFTSPFRCRPDYWLEVSVHLEGPATSHLYTGFLGLPQCSKQRLRRSLKFPVAAAPCSCSPPYLDSSKLSKLSCKLTYNYFCRCFLHFCRTEQVASLTEALTFSSTTSQIRIAMSLQWRCNLFHNLDWVGMRPIRQPRAS
jgi:hypothetical protein